MLLYQLVPVDGKKFESLLNGPTASQIKQVVALLADEPHANEWFEEEPPVWGENPAEWVRARFSADDWYADLREPEMLAWQHAMRGILVTPAMRSKARFTRLPVDGIPELLFRVAIEAREQAGEDASFLRMTPYRLNKLPAKVTKQAPHLRIFWPDHALVTPAGAKSMVEVFAQYDSLVNGLKPRNANLKHEFGLDGVEVQRDVVHLVTFLKELVRSDAYWYAPVDM